METKIEDITEAVKELELAMIEKLNAKQDYDSAGLKMQKAQKRWILAKETINAL